MTETSQTPDVLEDASDVKPGYERRAVIWPGTNERFMALFPVQSHSDLLASDTGSLA